MVKEFKAFLFRGNVLDLAVAFIIGAAFNAVVQSFADDVLMQLIAAIVGQPDTSDIAFEVNDNAVPIGLFIGAIINFVIIGFALFMVVKAAGKFQRAEPDEESPAPDTDEVILLREIRDALVPGRGA